MKSQKKHKRKPAKRARAKRSSFKAWQREAEELFSRIRTRPAPVAFDAAAAVAGGMSRGEAEVIALLSTGETPKWPGRPKGAQQSETLERIRHAAALKSLNYSQPKMAPLLYPGQHDPEEGRKDVNRFLNRNKAALTEAVKAMTREQAEQIEKSLIAKSLPRVKN